MAGLLIGTPTVADNVVTLAKMAGGTDGNIISYDASGDPVAIATGNNGQVLTSAGTNNPPAFEDAGGGTALSGSTNNTVTTVTGADAIQGEANLTCDGDNLHLQVSAVGGTAPSGGRENFIIEKNGDAGMTIKTGTGSDGVISFSDTTELKGGIRYDHSSDYFFFYTAGTTQLKITDAGNCNANGNVVSNQFDFGEFFEWEDGNPDDEYRAGETVILVGEKIKIATASDSVEDIIGVISETASFIGNAASFGWHNKYVTDDFGKKEWIKEDNVLKQKMNPDYDETQEYIEREKRKEWTIVGLLGQVAIKKTAPKKSNWIKLKDVSDTVEQWFVK